jgi:hypothetical protein
MYILVEKYSVDFPTIPSISDNSLRKGWSYRAWWYICVISALRRLRQENLEFEASLIL